MQTLKQNVHKETVEAEKSGPARSTARGISSSAGQIEQMKRRVIRETARAWKLDHQGQDEAATDRQSADVASSASSRARNRTTSLTGDSKTSDASR